MSADILRQIDEEIARLQSVRALLAGREENSATSANAAAPKRKRRKLSAEARKRIAEAQRRRWANAKGKAAA